MTVTDLRPTIVPKSDQLNADDLIGRTLDVTISKVLLTAEADQPVAIHYEGDGGKPFKACKSMRRVLVQCWGPDANLYVGRSMRLYRDPNVRFGGVAVGGIRISHLSHIEREITMALTETRASRKPFTVRVLAGASARPVPAGPREEMRPPSSSSRASDFDAVGTYGELERQLGEVSVESLAELWRASQPTLFKLREAMPDAYQKLVDLKERRKVDPMGGYAA